MSYELTLKHCQVLLNTFCVCLELCLLHIWLTCWVLKCFFSHFLKFLQVVSYELTLEYCLVGLKAQTRFDLFLGWLETKFVALRYFVSVLGLEVLFSHFLKFWQVVSYKLTLKHCLVVLKIQVILTHVLNTFQVRLSLLHLVVIFGLEMLFSTFLVDYELQTYTQDLLGHFENSSNTQTRFEHVLAWFALSLLHLHTWLPFWVLQCFFHTS